MILVRNSRRLGRPPAKSYALFQEVGTVANVGSSTVNSVTPSDYPKSDTASSFGNWCGGVFNPEFGSQGGYVVHGSGHLGPGASLLGGVWVFDLASQTWVGRNVPSPSLVEGQAFNVYGESTVSANLGHTYPPHTYQGLVIQPSALGGGTDGSLLRVGGGGSGHRAVHRFDLSSPTAPPTRVVDNLWPELETQTACGTARDDGRNGFWAISDSGSILKFVNLSTWAVTNTGVSNPIERYGCLAYVPDRDCLVLIGGVPWSPSTFRMYVSQITGNQPASFTQVATSGVAWPAEPMGSGVQWSTILGKLVLYQGRANEGDTTGAMKVYTCDVPANLTGDTWAWSLQTMTGTAPGITRNDNLEVLNNGVFGRFVEAPIASCMLYAGSVASPISAFRLTGM